MWPSSRLSQCGPVNLLSSFSFHPLPNLFDYAGLLIMAFVVIILCLQVKEQQQHLAIINLKE